MPWKPASRCAAVLLAVQEDALLGVGDAGAAVDGLELGRVERRRQVLAADPHVVGGHDARALDDVRVGGDVAAGRAAVPLAVLDGLPADAEVLVLLGLA